MGLKDLKLNDDNVLQLTIESLGDFYVEDVPPYLLVYVVKELEKPALKTYKKALLLCHYRQKNPFMTSVGLFEEGGNTKLIFLIRLPHSEITEVNLDKAIAFLNKLHTQISKIEHK